jgi:hypothetical protein
MEKTPLSDEPTRIDSTVTILCHIRKLTHTTNRKKYQNIIHDPRVSISITDVDNPYTYAEYRS